MRSGNWCGLAVAIALGAVAVLGGPALESRADGLFHHTIPRETLALDYRTGDVMMAPPIPYGHYAKDYAGAVHGAAGMTFGAVHEMTTAQAYRRMIEIADHPVLTHILKAIIREESAHTQFYWSIARLELRKNDLAQKLARKVIENFYYPVGLVEERKNEARGIYFVWRGRRPWVARQDRDPTRSTAPRF